MKKQYIPAQSKIVTLDYEQSVLLTASANTYIDPENAMSKKNGYCSDDWDDEEEY